MDKWWYCESLFWAVIPIKILSRTMVGFHEGGQFETALVTQLQHSY